MKVALAQILSTQSPEQNLQQVIENATAAANEQANLVVFPEATMCAFGNDIHTVAEPLEGEWAHSVRSVASELGITIVLGMFTPGASSKVRNTVLIASPENATFYTKIHLFDAFAFKESDTVEPGKEAHVVDVGGTTIGLGICYDIRFPQLFLKNAAEGAVIHVVPTSWGSGENKAEQWEVLTRARALDTTSFVVAVDQADPASVGREVQGAAPTGIGRSAVVDPFGRDVIRLGRSPELAIVEIDLGLVTSARDDIPVLENQIEFSRKALNSR